MAKYCPECATPLDVDARFCPSCRASVSMPPLGAGAIASELRAGIGVAVHSVVASDAMRVPKSVWAGVIESFLALLTLPSMVMAGIGPLSVALGANLPFARSSEYMGERAVVVLMATALFYLAQLSLQLPLIVGFIGCKRWAYPLYLWTIGPIVVGNVLLLFASSGTPEPSGPTLGISIVRALAIVAWFLLIALQIYVVLKIKKDVQ